MPSESDCCNRSVRRKCEGAHEGRESIKWCLIEKCGNLPIRWNHCRSRSRICTRLVCEIKSNLRRCRTGVGDREACVDAVPNFRIDPSGLHRRHCRAPKIAKPEGVPLPERVFTLAKPTLVNAPAPRLVQEAPPRPKIVKGVWASRVGDIDATP